LIGCGLVAGLNRTEPARYDRNRAWAIKTAGADPKTKARAQATDFEAVSSG
jgi:hypothetical protein